jgi:hypothetical protein
MINRNSAAVQIPTNPRLPRIVSSVPRSFEFSSPAPGRPKVFWTQGINPGIVREHWASQGEVPYEERTPPLHVFKKMRRGPRTRKCYSLGVTKKMVTYERAHPEIRLVLLLDVPYDADGTKWQPIVKMSVERDRSVDPRQSRRREELLWNEVCRVERRGRPRGTGHPKKATLRQFPLSSARIARLRRAGLDDKDLRILFGRWETRSFKQLGRHLGISAQAVWKRWTRKIVPVIKRVNPRFSSGSFELSSLDSK